jgi:hypothetical protein
MINVLASLAAAAVVSATTEVSWASECAVRINQPAASVQLNRPDVPGAVCVKDCEARLIGAHREFDYVVGLAIYTGKHCR